MMFPYQNITVITAAQNARAKIKPNRFVNHSCSIPCSDVQWGQRVLNAGVDWRHLGQYI